MRHLTTMMLLVAITMASLPATAQIKELGKYSNMENVDYAYITHEMIDLAVSQGMEIAGLEFIKSDLLDKVAAIQIVDIEDAKTKKVVKKEVTKFLSKSKYKTLMTTGEDGESTKILYKTNGKQTSLIEMNEDDDTYSIIAVSGSFTIDDIKADSAE